MTASETTALVVIGTLVFLDRWPVLQTMASRPLVVGAAVGVALGDPIGGATWGAVFEAMYLGQLPVGAARLPDAGLAALTGTTAALLGASGGVHPAALAGALAWCAGHAGTLADGLQRRWNGSLASYGRQGAETGDPGAVGRAVAAALVAGAGLGVIVSVLAVVAAWAAVSWLGGSPWAGPLGPGWLRLVAVAGLVVTGGRAFVRGRGDLLAWSGGAVAAGLLVLGAG